MNRRPVVFVTSSQHRECTVVPHQIGVHALGYGNLPRVVLTQAVGGVTLTQSDAVRLGVSDDLPAERMSLARTASLSIAPSVTSAHVTGLIQTCAAGLRCNQRVAGPARPPAV